MFNKYQQESCGTFKPAVPLTPEQVHLLDWAMGLGGESGEVLDLLKHAIFHQDAELDKMELAKELGDVLWYASAIATTCNIDLADIAALNRAKLTHRYNKGYSTAESAARHEKEIALKDTAIYKCLKARILNTGCAPLNVIVVGPDGSGKTTFTTALSELAGLTRIKCDYRQENKPQLARQLLTSRIDILYDRFYYPDEYIYSIVKQMPLDSEYLNDLLSVLDVLQTVNPVFIYVDADIDTLRERSAAWADDYVSIADLLRIKEEYEKWLSKMQELNIPIIRLDTSNIKNGTREYGNMLKDVMYKLDCCRAHYGTSNIGRKEE
jgi:NTP pyrophosphatase (non-canonical NTP hydrolase)/deoxyadenosine/deoxycytidine kinase